jgi:hypothetical protein
VNSWLCKSETVAGFSADSESSNCSLTLTVSLLRDVRGFSRASPTSRSHHHLSAHYPFPPPSFHPLCHRLATLHPAMADDNQNTTSRDDVELMQAMDAVSYLRPRSEQQAHNKKGHASISQLHHKLPKCTGRTQFWYGSVCCRCVFCKLIS